MQVNANGIPIDIPRLRKRVKTNTPKILHNDYEKYSKFATMTGFEDGCYVTAVVPIGHKEYKTMLSQGYRVIEVWDKRNVKGETA